MASVTSSTTAPIAAQASSAARVFVATSRGDARIGAARDVADAQGGQILAHQGRRQRPRLPDATEAPGVLRAWPPARSHASPRHPSPCAPAARHSCCCRRYRAPYPKAPRRASASARPARSTPPARAPSPAPSVPRPSGPSPAATAAAAPPDEPPEVRSKFHGLRVVPKEGPSVSPFTPNSGVVVLPMMIAPAARSRATSTLSRAAGDSLARKSPSRGRVGTPATSTRSLICTGTPCSGPSGAPDATAVLGRDRLAPRAFLIHRRRSS